MSKKFQKPVEKMNNVSYEIRGTIFTEAKKLMAQGYDVIQLNIGNPYRFGFQAADCIIKSIQENVAESCGYEDSQGILSARQAIIEYNNKNGIKDNDPNMVFVGNGVSELIIMITNAILDIGEEILLPMPDYPLWTAATNLAGGKAIHYECVEANNWEPNIEDIENNISYKTKAILIINPNNPTGAVYSKEVLQKIINIAQKHNLLILSDEIYDRVLYGDAKHIPIASLAPKDVLCITFNGLSKSYMSCGYRVGWFHLTGDVKNAQGLLDSIHKLSSMRLCANIAMQHAVKPALEIDHSIQHQVQKGRLLEQRNIVYDKVNKIKGLSCNEIMGTLYTFVKFDPTQFDFIDDYDLVLKFLLEEKVLLVHGRGFNWPQANYFRIVFLPNKEQLELALDKLSSFLDRHRL